MNNKTHHSTLEAVPVDSNQAGLEVNPNYVPAKFEDKNLPVGNAGKDERKILGLRRTVFFIVAGLVGLLVIGAIIGGAVGGTSGKNKSKLSPASTPPTPVDPASSSTPPGSTSNNPNSANTTAPSTSKLLVDSKLATVNWTDSKNYQHHALFYQNSTGSLTLSLWDSQNKSWAISPVFVPGLQIDPTLNGTSIATSVDNINFQLNVYFYSIKQEIKEFYTNDQQARAWVKGDLTDRSNRGYPNSQLTAYSQLCASRDCCNSTVVLYQDPDQKLRYMNGSDGWSNVRSVLNTAIAPQTGMAVIPHTNANDPKRLPVVLTVYVENNEITQEFTGGNRGWGGAFTLTTKAQDSSQFAALPIKDRNQIRSDIFVATLYPNGTVASQWCQDDQWGDTTLPMINGTETKNYTAIAINQDQRFYGISSGQIYEYEIGDLTPLSWNYIGVVGT